MNRTKMLVLIAAIMALVLLILIGIAISLGSSPEGSDPGSLPTPSTSPTDNSSEPSLPQVTDPTGTEPPVTEPPVTEPPATEPPATEPPATEPPATRPAGPYDDLVNGIYTRDQLMAMENVKKGYGPGTAVNGNRAPYAVNNQNAYSQYGANFIGPDDGNIYLTFDCGYEFTATDANGNPWRVTEHILNTLKEKNVKAVFFVTMHYVKSQPDLVQRMINEGHVVGNHSNHHYSMPTLEVEDMVYEVMSLHDYVKQTFGYEMWLFRPPMGEFSMRSLAAVQNIGYKTVHWSFAYVDWSTAEQPDPTSALQTVTSQHHSGAIYLLHAVSVTNATILGDAIDYFRDAGYNLELFR